MGNFRRFFLKQTYTRKFLIKLLTILMNAVMVGENGWWKEITMKKWGEWPSGLRRFNWIRRFLFQPPPGAQLFLGNHPRCEDPGDLWVKNRWNAAINIEWLRPRLVVGQLNSKWKNDKKADIKTIETF